jgi:hypothetical protein
MKINKLYSDLYIDFLIASQSKATATLLSAHLGDGYSHDLFTKMLLNDSLDTDKELFQTIKPMLRDYEDDENGVIIVDDTIIEKKYTDENDIVAWHYDHKTGSAVKGICMLNFLYFAPNVGYELISKTEKYEENGKEKRKSLFSKNETMCDKLEIIQNINKVKFKYILADSWFGSIKNMNFVEEELNKKFVFGLKSNRLVALSEKDKINGIFCKIRDVDMEGCSSRLVYMKGFKKPLKLTKLFVKNGNDGESIYSYLISNDIETSDILEIYKRRWKVEEYHKSLKQNLNIEKSPTRTITSQSNHIFFSVCAFVRLEKMKCCYKLNHFALKNKIYLTALNQAMKLIETLKVA